MQVKKPSDFIVISYIKQSKSIGHQVRVRLNSGVDYKGKMVTLDGQLDLSFRLHGRRWSCHSNIEAKEAIYYLISEYRLGFKSFELKKIPRNLSTEKEQILTEIVLLGGIM